MAAFRKLRIDSFRSAIEQQERLRGGENIRRRELA
jgi:hypothetical protein